MNILRSRKWQSLANPMLVLGGICAGLVVSEAVLRIVWPQPLPFSEGMFRDEPGDLGYRFNPHLHLVQTGPDGPEFDFVIDTNSDGLRDGEIGPKGEHDFRILILGDSYTLGFGAEQEEAYPQVLEDRLNAGADGWRYDVINAGVPAYTVRQERIYLERYGMAFQPDLVIITVTRNDYDAAAGSPLPLSVDASGYLILPERAAIATHSLPLFGLKWPQPFHLGVFLQLNSHLYRAAGRYIPALVVDVVQQQEIIPGKSPAADLDAGVLSITRDLARAGAAAESGGASLGVILVPDPSELLRKCRRPETVEPHRQLAEQLEAKRVPYLNTLPQFCQHPDPASLRWPNDGHFKPEGYRLLGEYVAAFLSESKLLPDGRLMEP